MPVELVEDDSISRCIIHSRFFNDNVHTDSMLWQFGESKADGASHESGVLRRLAPSDDEVNRIGCSMAAFQNARDCEPPPGPKRRYYCGFRTARYGDLPLESEGYRLVITNIPENGEESHLDFALTITVQGRAPRANRKTDAGLALAEHFSPARPHRCTCDLQDNEHPFSKFGESCLYGAMPSIGNLEFSPRSTT
jgi:hypothetical protein